MTSIAPIAMGSVAIELNISGGSQETLANLSPAEQRLLQTLTAALTATANRNPKAAKIALARATRLNAMTAAPLPSGVDAAQIRAAMAQIPVGLPPIAALAGVQPILEFGPGLHCIAAPTSAGKTSILLQQTLEWLLHPDLTGKIIFWSCETPAPMLIAKLVSNLAGVVFWDVVNTEREPRIPTAAIAAAWATLEPVLSRLIVLDDSMSAHELCELGARLADTPGGLDALIVDYVQTLPAVPASHPDAAKWARSRELEVGAVAVMLRQFGLECEVPVVTAAQFNRGVGKTNQYVPGLQLLRESGRIEQECTTVIGLRNAVMAGVELSVESDGGVAETKTYPWWDDDVLAAAQQSALLSVHCEHAEDSEDWTLLEGFVLKNRYHGGVGTVIPFAFHPASGRCEPIQARLSTYQDRATKSKGKDTDRSGKEAATHGVPDWL